MHTSSLKLESLESRTLLAALIDGEALDSPDAEANLALDIEDTRAAPHDMETSDGEKHEKHGIKHKLSNAADKIKGEIEHTADTIKGKAMHTLDKTLEKTGNAIRSSETATKVTEEAIKVTAKVLTKLT